MAGLFPIGSFFPYTVRGLYQIKIQFCYFSFCGALLPADAEKAEWEKKNIQRPIGL